MSFRWAIRGGHTGTRIVNRREKRTKKNGDSHRKNGKMGTAIENGLLRGDWTASVGPQGDRHCVRRHVPVSHRLKSIFAATGIPERMRARPVSRDTEVVNEIAEETNHRLRGLPDRQDDHLRDSGIADQSL